MARTSRKAAIRAALTGETPGRPDLPPRRVWKAAGYARLSVMETRGRKDGESLRNQRALLTAFIQSRPDLRLRSFYEDEGETGTRFDRPGFQRLLEDAEAGRIDCIVVKDLSRFGRDYLETGNYLERILPQMGVRFIAINDGYDSLDAGDTLRTAMKNLVNQAYSMDVSRKTTAVLREKQRQGAFIGAKPAYGYRKDPANKNHLTIDPETAPVVREIFSRRAGGESCAAIARWLNDAGISTPSVYRYRSGILKDPRYERGGRLWSIRTVKGILSNRVYLGCTVQGTSRSAFYEGRRRQPVPPSEWIVVEHTHEPIVTRKEFAAVQGMTDAAR